MKFRSACTAVAVVCLLSPARLSADVIIDWNNVMLDAISQLPPLYREPFVLKHLQDWSYAQIGDALGLPIDTVETRLVRARRLLREQLAGKV